MMYAIPKEIIIHFLELLPFQSKYTCEQVCKLWKESVNVLTDYLCEKEILKEEYTINQLFPSIMTYSQNIIDIFGKRGIYEMPVNDVYYTYFSVEFEKELVHFMLRNNCNFCRGQDRNGLRYVAILYHLWTGSDVPKLYHNCAIVFCESAFSLRCEPNDRKIFWEIESFAMISNYKQVKELIEKGSINHPVVWGASSITLGSNKKDCQSIFWYEAEIMYDYLAMNFRNLIGRRRYTTFA